MSRFFFVAIFLGTLFYQPMTMCSDCSKTRTNPLLTAYSLIEAIQKLPTELQCRIAEYVVEDHWEDFGHIVLTQPYQTTPCQTSDYVISALANLELLDNGTEIAIKTRLPGALDRGFNDPQHILVISIEDGTVLRTFNCNLWGHIAEHNGLIADASDKEVTIFSATTGNPLYHMEVSSYHFKPIIFKNKNKLVTGANHFADQQINVCNPEVKTHIILKVPSEIVSLDLSPDETKIACNTTRNLLLYDLGSNDPSEALEYNHMLKINEGMPLGFISNEYVLISFVGIVVIWDTLTNELTDYFLPDEYKRKTFSSQEEALDLIKSKSSFHTGFPEGEYFITDLHIDKQKSTFIIALANGYAQQWDLTSGKRIRTFLDRKRTPFAQCKVTDDNTTLIALTAPWNQFKKSWRNINHILDPDVISFWKLVSAPSSFCTGKLTIKELLFLLTIKHLKGTTPSFDALLNQLPAELQEVYQSFSSEEQQFIHQLFYKHLVL